jgi:hypothetical protein
MRHLILAIFCAAALAIAPVPAQSQSYKAPAPAPTEPSFVIAEKPAVVKPAEEAPKPVVRHRIVHRIGKVPIGPVTVPPSEALIMMSAACWRPSIKQTSPRTIPYCTT